MDAQLEASVLDLLLDLVAVLGREPAGTEESGLVVRRGVDLDEQCHLRSRATATAAQQRQQRSARVRRVDQSQAQLPSVIHVDLGELQDAALQGINSVAAAVGITQVLEDRKPAVVARDRKRLVSALPHGEAREMDNP